MAKKKVDLESASVVFDFTKDGGEALAVSAEEIPGYVPLSGTALQIFLHGISQKVGDGYASAKKQADPTGWSMAQVKAALASLREGIFNPGRTGEATVKVSILARAINRVKLAAGEESTELAAQAFVDGLTKEQAAEYRSKKKIARALDAIRLEDATARLARAQAKLAAGEDDEDEDEEEDQE